MKLLLLPCFLLVTESLGCHLSFDKVYGGTFADCSRRNLTRLPTDLPENTTSLDMNKNNITSLHVPPNSAFESLKYLDISYNSISHFESGSFKSLENLEVLLINNNNLSLDNRCYPDDIFQPLKNLLKLHLHNNDQQFDGSYPEEAIGYLKRVEELKIDSSTKTNFGYGFSKLCYLKRLILGFQACKLAHVQNRTFENLRNVSLELVDVDECPIIKVETGSFLPLKDLKYLYMSDGFFLEPTGAMLAMYGFRGRNLSTIEMNRVFAVRDYRKTNPNARIISNDVMLYLKDVCVDRFTMINNQLLWFGRAIAKNTVFGKCIKYLDLSNNDFYGDVTYMFELSMLSNLVYLNLSNHARGRSTSTTKNIQLTSSVGFTLPKTLEVLNFDGFNVGHQLLLTGNVHIYNATSLRYFSYASNGLARFEKRIIGFENLTYFDISGSNFSVMNPYFFADFPRLESLNLADVNFKEYFLLQYGKNFFLPMKKLKRINLYNNNIRLLDLSIFSSSQVEEILVARNRFESIPFDLMTTPNLHYLDLSYNSVTVLSAMEMKLLDDLNSRNNLSLNIEGNLLSCGCLNLDFIIWLFNTNIHVIRVDTYTCQMSDGAITNASYIRDHFEEIWMRCNGKVSLSITIALFAVLLVAMFVTYFTLERKTLLVNIILRMFGYGPLTPTLKRTEFPNDAYIGYSDADYQYICHTVRDHLENRHGLKLFIRDRDTIPGGQIADDIISGIDCSWRTVLFLTTAFLDDQWCQFTVSRVVYSSTRQSQRSVLLILFDDVMRGDIDPALLSVVEERNIFYTERYRGDEALLWKDICDRINEHL